MAGAKKRKKGREWGIRGGGGGGGAKRVKEREGSSWSPPPFVLRTLFKTLEPFPFPTLGTKASLLRTLHFIPPRSPSPGASISHINPRRQPLPVSFYF